MGISISHILGSYTEIAETIFKNDKISDLMAHSDLLFIRFSILKVQDLHKLQLGNFVFTWRQQSTPARFKF